jgi:hypothetical protein
MTITACKKYSYESARYSCSEKPPNWMARCTHFNGVVYSNPSLGASMTNFRLVPRSTLLLTGLLTFALFGLFAVQLDAQTNSTWNSGTGNWSDISN